MLVLSDLVCPLCHKQNYLPPAKHLAGPCRFTPKQIRDIGLFSCHIPSLLATPGWRKSVQPRALEASIGCLTDSSQLIGSQLIEHPPLVASSAIRVRPGAHVTRKRPDHH